MDRLEQFIAERCVKAPGQRTRFASFVDAFQRSLPAAERGGWPRHRIAAAIDALGLPRGKQGGQIHVGNLALPDHTYVRDGRRLRREPIEAT